MTNLFLYGTLRHLPLLELVAGCDPATLRIQPAVLHNHGVSVARGHGFPLITAQDGALAEGLVVRDVPEVVLERLNFYELGFGYDLHRVEVELDGGGKVAAFVYMPKPGLWQAGAAFDLEQWVAAHWPLTRHAAQEVMGYFGQLSGEEVARRYRMIETRAHANQLAETETVPCAVRSNMGDADVAPVAEEISHAGFFLLKTMQLRHRRFDGAMSEEIEREVFVAGDATTVLPYDPGRDRVLLIEQFRMGPFGRGDGNPWMLEPIAGRIDGGESATSAGLREAEEEAGLSIKSLELIARYYGSPGASTEMYHSYLGIADLPDGAAGIGGEDAEHEDIKGHVLSFDRAMALIETGEINNGPLILSLLWLARERGRLQGAAI